MRNYMSEYRHGEIEKKLADLIWKNSPIPSGELVKLAEIHLGWKKSTTYTVLRRLCERGIFENHDGIVESLISKQEFTALQTEEFVSETFNGSLPSFIAAFAERKKLSRKEIEEIQEIINKNRM